MTDAIRNIGDEFARGNFFLPDLIGASSAMLNALPVLEEAIMQSGEKRSKIGKAVIGTVYGDIHNIGKAIVSTLLMASGFEVNDLGTNIKPDQFVEEVQKSNADILAMSALMTTTAPEQKATIELLSEKGLRDKVIVLVGGSAINESFAQSIGADGYAPTAPEAVELAKNLLANRKL
jgi:5-methyltetrahydrofolate--homocysteine methyltransferase